MLVPLFSIPTAKSWGIGEIPDLAVLARWMNAAEQQLIQLLPVNEMAPSETSPYGALSAMAIDPQYISLRHLEDWHASGGEETFTAQQRETLEAVRRSRRVEYDAVRTLKMGALRQAFEWFLAGEWGPATGRAGEFREYCESRGWWLEEYALFRAIRGQQSERPWTEWPVPLRNRLPEALAIARRELAHEILFRQYVQWVADVQWRAARRAAGQVALFGDLPFMVSGDSADAWARQHEFRRDTSVGTPPDAFSATGQNWGLPVYRWDVVADGGYQWLRQRARRNAELFDGYRVDHLVGFYRTYSIPHDGSGARFTPEQEHAQVSQGERVLGVLREAGTPIFAEDLGVVPDFVRASLERLHVPGYKVFRWERRWHEPGRPFIDPADYPAVAVATSGTHDTEPLVTWWSQASLGEREAVLAVPSVRGRMSEAERTAAVTERALTTACRHALLKALYASPAEVVVLPLGDVFGWSDRINQPATVGPENWSWRLPWAVERMLDDPDALRVAAQVAEWAHCDAR